MPGTEIGEIKYIIESHMKYIIVTHIKAKMVAVMVVVVVGEWEGVGNGGLTIDIKFSQLDNAAMGVNKGSRD